MSRHTSLVARLLLVPAALTTSASAALVQAQVSGEISGSSGVFFGIKSMASTIVLDMQIDPLSSSNNPTIGAWTLSVVDASKTPGFTVAGYGRSSPMTFSTVTLEGVSTRRYTFALANPAGASAIGGHTPTQFQFTFVARPNGSGGVMKFGDSIGYGPAASRGSIAVVAGGDPFGMFSTSGFSAVPTPGVAAMIAAAGILTSRRRTAAA